MDMNRFNARSDATTTTGLNEEGVGDDVLCIKCGGYLDTGLECVDCEYDNWLAVTGKPRKPNN